MQGNRYVVRQTGVKDSGRALPIDADLTQHSQDYRRRSRAGRRFKSRIAGEGRTTRCSVELISRMGL
jgi:hypothetical protein